LRADRHLELFLARLGMMKEKIWWCVVEVVDERYLEFG
jgi:hypothetical protein